VCKIHTLYGKKTNPTLSAFLALLASKEISPRNLRFEGRLATDATLPRVHSKHPKEDCQSGSKGLARR
jgi:hypothetical protein